MTAIGGDLLASKILVLEKLVVSCRPFVRAGAAGRPDRVGACRACVVCRIVLLLLGNLEPQRLDFNRKNRS